MAIILNIDTAIETASVCVARDGQILSSLFNANQRDHSSWLHPALQQVLNTAGMTMNDPEAIAITIGPGSYTGLRVGLAAAKGLCFALKIPLVPLNTLEVMASTNKDEDVDLICPLIDARRMEVFMAVYDKKLVPVIEPRSMIIDATSFESMLLSHRILFSGTGSGKLRTIINHPNALFSDKMATAGNMVHLSEQYFLEKKFADTAYVEPLYIKEFYFAAR